MSTALVECVPNFSEGRRKDVIDAISAAISSSRGCHLLDVDPGVSTNRTVYTFVGSPDDCVEGALAAARVAHKLIDMRVQTGEHPRIGAMDVCPFIPVRNITIQECVELSKRFGKRLSEELDVPVYLYAESQPLKWRAELPSIRKGEYEALCEKLSDEKWRPDYGPCEFRPRYGATCVGARNFLIAFNINILGTKEQAHRIALNVREQGRSEKEPGRLKQVKAIGWWLDEENMAQISMNLTDFRTTNLHQAFEECEKDAREINVSTCGSQIVGLIPLEAVLAAADYYIKRDGLLILEEENKVKLVIQRLGLNSISQFNPKERIIEYIIREKLSSESEEKYARMSVRGFVESVGARTSIPGGGCVAALCASLGSSLACMVASLTYGNRKFESLDKQIRQVLPPLYDSYNQLATMIDQDAAAFNSYVDALKLSETSPDEKIKKSEAKLRALYRCIEVPHSVAQQAHALWPYLRQLAPIFNIETKSDLQVAVKCLETGIFGAYANVAINLKSFDANDVKAKEIFASAERIWKESQREADEIQTIINQRSK